MYNYKLNILGFRQLTNKQFEGVTLGFGKIVMSISHYFLETLRLIERKQPLTD